MSYRILFQTGIGFILIGQIILSKGNEFVYNLKPIDFAHWFMLIGVVLLIPQVISFPKKPISFIGIPLTIIGITCMIGMCVIDFIFWSYPNDQLRNEFTKVKNQPVTFTDFNACLITRSKSWCRGEPRKTILPCTSKTTTCGID